MTNKLAQSTSPYLQQHAGNPVHWQEWGPDALAQSRRSGKPILLSIGYSACHWCHVMAHESFEDPDIARLMNELFINIKVDREERPDIDQIYQRAHSLLTQRSGGWPLTMFLAPDTTPFFGGTYFPATARYGLPGFAGLLKKVEHYYRSRPDDLREQNLRLRAALDDDKPAADSAAGALSREPIDAALGQMAHSFDSRRGGFGAAPKFPHPEMIEFCLRRFAATGSEVARHIACFTLESMCRGGIYDQIGGGFARYAVDADWAIPHFEKMLYDNGPLLRLLADAWLIAENDAQKALFAGCATNTARWVMREMQAPAGGYFSSFDADSEGQEGKFYVWTPDQIEALLTADEWQVARRHFGLDKPANFEQHYWHLQLAIDLPVVAAELSVPLAEAEQRLARACEKLLAARATRVWPGRDEKILTSWNALMIEGMAHAGRIFGEPEWVASARRALDFVGKNLWQSGRLLVTHKDGVSHLNAYLDDYAFLLKALLEMAQADFRTGDLTFSLSLADALLSQFEDCDNSGFFFTSHDHEPLIQRPKPGFDNATPSGNGVAAVALQRLAHLSGDLRYQQAAERTLAHFYSAIEEHPSGHGTLLVALEECLAPSRVLVLAGPAEGTRDWQARLSRCYLPDLLTLSPGPAADGLPPPLIRPAGEQVNAYLCQGVTCLPALSDWPQLQAALNPPIVRAAN